MATDSLPTSRRAVLGGTAGVALGGLLAGFGTGRASANASTEKNSLAEVENFKPGYLPFHGQYQSGILDPPQAHAIFLGFDLRWDGTDAQQHREQLRSVLAMLSDDAERLMSGRGVLADTEPEMAKPPANLSLTLGVSSEILTLVGQSAQSLQALPAFTGDRLQKEFGQSHILVQCCAEDPTVLEHAVRAVRKNLRGITQMVFNQRGFAHVQGSAESGTSFRNLFGQVDGTNNPRAETRELAVFGVPENPSWIKNGTTLVLRRLQMDLDTWDEVDRAGRDFALGRRQSDGSPLSGKNPEDPVDLSAEDALGLPAIAAHAHVARAAPTSGDEVLWRRGYNYVDGERAGLLFASYQRDPRSSFIPVQQRLATADALNEWITPVGSALYAILPGVQPGERLGDQLFASPGLS